MYHLFGCTRRRCIKTVGVLPILLVLVLVVWSYYAYVFIFCPQIYATSPLQATSYFLLCHAFLVPFAWSYYLVVMTSPGHPIQMDETTPACETVVDIPLNDGLRRDVSNSSLDNGPPPLAHMYTNEAAVPLARSNDRGYEDVALDPAEGAHGIAGNRSLEVKSDGKRRYCNKCANWKPDRTHHCSVCGICVLKLDHHCPWLNNCVGFYNYKFFFLFILYGVLYCLFLFVTLALNIGNFNDFLMGIGTMGFQPTFILIVSGVFALCLLIFLGVHLHLVLSNKSTIESMEGDRRVRLPDGSIGTAPSGNLYDLGTRKNLVQVFGKRWQLWLVPVYSSIGDGHHFPYNRAVYRKLFAEA
ncbi:Palmitoyltransferase zdhhc15 [Geranomyces variabilis]|nr:Palmitoyltransferase zdhhc15 [Geranomyces variabilis]